MLNNVQKSFGYREIIYNVKNDKYYTYLPGDNYKELDIAGGGVTSGGSNEKPSAPSPGDLFWDTDLDALLVWNGTEWSLIGSVGDVDFPTSTDGLPEGVVNKYFPEAPNDGKQYTRQSEGWAEVVDDPGIEEAPTDGKQYARQSESWAEIVAADTGIEEAPDDGKQYVRQSEAWSEITPSVAGGIDEAPEDGTPYARQDAAWISVPTGGGTAGVSSIIAGAGISVDQATGDVTVTATGGGGGATAYATPQDFGAVGDGVTDDTQALIDWLQSGGDLYAPEGTYLVDYAGASSGGVRAKIDKNVNVVCHPDAIFKGGQGLDYDMVQIKRNDVGFNPGEEVDVFWDGGQFDMRVMATSTSVPSGGSWPPGPGGQGQSGITDGLSIRGQVGDSSTGVYGFRKVQVRNVRFFADDPADPHWQRAGGDSGIFVAGTQHQDVSDCTFFGIRDLGIYGSGVSTGITVPNSSAVFRNNVFTGCYYCVTMKRDMDNIVMIGNIGINCAGLCACSHAQTPRAGANNIFANNIGTNCGYIVNLKLCSEASVYGNASYNHGHLDQNGNAFNTSPFNTDYGNACVQVEGSYNNDIANNVVHSVDPTAITNNGVDVYTVVCTDYSGTPSSNNTVHENTGRGVRSVVKDVPGVATFTQAWGNVGRDISVTDSPYVDINKGADGGLDRDGAIAESYSATSHTGTTATTELKNGLIKAGNRHWREN